MNSVDEVRNSFLWSRGKKHSENTALSPLVRLKKKKSLDLKEGGKSDAIAHSSIIQVSMIR